MIRDLNMEVAKYTKLTDFITVLRRHKKSDIANVGTTLLWDVFHNKQKYPLERAQVINAYAPKLIFFGLATANNLRDKPLTNTDFYNLCHDFLGIKESINDKAFMDHESKCIFEILTNKTGKAKIIPDKYLVEEIIRGICPLFFICRTVALQHETYFAGTNEFYMTYDVLVRLNNLTNGKISEVFVDTFNLDMLRFMRSAFGLFALGNDKNGYISFQGLTCEDKIKEILEIDISTCNLVASKVSYNESSLRKGWYEKDVLTQPELYQKYYPTPLYKSPLIKMDSSSSPDYLITSPGHYIRGIRESIFSQILPNSGFQSKVGNVIEDHVFTGLQAMFGADNVSRLTMPENGRTADFQVDLKDCVLIIECKSTVGAPVDLSIMSPEHTATIWSRLYESCEQCSSSMMRLQNVHKPVIPIVLVASHLTSETLPFQNYAFRTNIFRDMGIKYIEFFSWDALQHGLSVSSVEKLTNKILERMNNQNPTIQEAMTFDLDRDTPAHNYEYLKESEIAIHGKNFTD